MRGHAVSTEVSIHRPSELSRRLDPSLLPGHFVVGRSLPLQLPGWFQRQLDGWTLATEPRLPVQKLLDSAGADIGWLLGHAIDLESGTFITDSLRTPLQGEDAENGRDLEDWLYRFGGRFVAIILRPKPVLYPDAASTLPVLFDAELQCASSSPFLLCDLDGRVPDSPLVDAVPIFRTDTYFALGTTSHAQAELLLANHVLDLVCWKQSRAWPLSLFSSDDVEPLVERVAATLEKTLTAAATAGHPNMSLTAGVDTRSFLACSRGVVDRLHFFTVAFPDDLGTTDLATAPVLAKRFGLEHRILPWLEPSMSDLELFMYRTGCMIGAPRARMATRSYSQLGGCEVYISGVVSPPMGDEWERFDDPTMRLDAEDLLRRRKFPLHPELVRRAGDWLAALPEGFTGLDALSLFYLEMRGGAWGGLLTMAYPDAYTFTLYPYAHRAIMDAEFRFPWQYRRSRRLNNDLVAARWKELLDIPFNHPPVGVALRRQARRSARLAKAGFSWKAWNTLIRKAP